MPQSVQASFCRHFRFLVQRFGRPHDTGAKQEERQLLAKRYNFVVHKHSTLFGGNHDIEKMPRMTHAIPGHGSSRPSRVSSVTVGDLSHHPKQMA